VEINLPDKKYDVILMDPPWHYGNKTVMGAAENHYRTMKDADLMALDVPSLLKPTSVVFCWATGPRLDFAMQLMAHWGLYYRGMSFVWVKTTKAGVPIGAKGIAPTIVKSNCEFVLGCSLTKKGRPMPIADMKVPQVVMWSPQEHSKKPEEIHERIDRLYPDATKLEMFARRPYKNWDVWGNEVGYITEEAPE
jgi:N6-adenosine-specific RNA methylase IME4